jgi:hypothetical protein
MSDKGTEKPNYRELRFSTVADCLAELDRIEQAHRDGSLKPTGQWTAGQILSHLSAWIEYGYDGFPMKAPPFFIRWLVRFMMKRTVKKGVMASGVSIPGVEGGTYGQDEMETGAAIDRFRDAILRMQSEPAIHDSPAVGKVSDEFRIKHNLIHAQLHLGFLDYPS